MTAILTLSILGAALGLGLAFAADLLAVEQDPRIEGVEELLPGINCGACGYPGCNAFAEGVVEGEVEHLADCKPSTKKNYNAILQYLKDHPNKDGSVINVKI